MAIISASAFFLLLVLWVVVSVILNATDTRECHGWTLVHPSAPLGYRGKRRGVRVVLPSTSGLLQRVTRRTCVVVSAAGDARS